MNMLRAHIYAVRGNVTVNKTLYVLAIFFAKLTLDNYSFNHEF